MAKTWSIDALAAERPIRESLATHGPLPKDGWWFPDFVPKWARVLPRELYASVYTACSIRWEIEHSIRQTQSYKSGSDKRKAGRPPLTDEQEDMEFLGQVEATKMVEAEQGRPDGDTRILRQILGKQDVTKDRARLNRIRKKLGI